MKKRSDFERILMNIAIDTSGTVHDTMERLYNGWTLRFTFGEPAPQFLPLSLAEAINIPLKKNDIVKCKTNPNHHWGISVFLERLSEAEFLLQEIGGRAQLRMGNEMFEVLRFMNPARLYTGHQYQVYIWASRKAFSKRYNKNANTWKRCGGVEFDRDIITIWSRAHIWIMEKRLKDDSILYAQPKKFIMNWDKNTRLKDIIAAMDEQGFNLEFEYSPDKPTEGQAGYCSFDKDKIMKIINQ